MCPRPKPQVRFAPPVFQVMLRFKSRLRPIGNFVVMISRSLQRFLRHLVKLRHFIFAWHCSRAVLPAALQQFLSQAAPIINLQQIDRNMHRRQPRQFLQRLPPALLRLVRQPRYQIKTNIPNPRLAKHRHRTVNIRPPVHPPRRHQFLIHKRLHSKTNPIDPRRHPSGRLLRINGLRIRLQRHLFKFRCVGPTWSMPRLGRGGERLGVRRFTLSFEGLACPELRGAAVFPTAGAVNSGTRTKCFPNRIQNASQVSRIQQTRRPPANVNRVHGRRFVAQPILAVLLSKDTIAPSYPRPPQQLPMSTNLLANCLHIRRKPAARHHPGMKITIRALRLAERHLHVNP